MDYGARTSCDCHLQRVARRAETASLGYPQLISGRRTATSAVEATEGKSSSGSFRPAAAGHASQKLTFKLQEADVRRMHRVRSTCTRARRPAWCRLEFLNRIAESAVRASPDFRNDAAGAATSTSSKLPSDHVAIVVKDAPRCLRLIELVDDRDHPANALRRSDGRVINPVVGPK